MSMTSSLLLRPDLSSKIHPEQPEQEQKQEKEQEQEQEKDFTFLGIDHFDCLPDSLLLLVFNKIGDVKALGRCCVVSRRFHCLYNLWNKISDGADRQNPSPRLALSSWSRTCSHRSGGSSRSIKSGGSRPVQEFLKGSSLL
jgi:hypothetical protein